MRGDKVACGRRFDIVSNYIAAGERHLILLGVSGPGKTFSMARVIEELAR